MPQRLSISKRRTIGLHASFHSFREDWQMDMLSLAFYILVVVVVLAVGWLVVRPEKK